MFPNVSFTMDFTPLGVDATLTHAEGLLRRRRELEAEDLKLLLHWAGLHSTDPQAEAKARGQRIPPFADRLIQVGGEGTPKVQEFSIAELGVSREISTTACRNQLAEALDLAHRLPRVFRRVTDLECERWVAGKLSRMTRHLSVEQARIVDEAVADCVASLPTGRLLSLVEGKILEVDEEGEKARRDQQLRRRHVSLGRTSEYGLRLLIANIKASDAAFIDAMVDRVADLLAPRFAPGTTKDVLRSEAMGLLARPVELLQLLVANGDPEELAQSQVTAITAELVEALHRVDASKLKAPGIVHVHLHEAAVMGVGTGVARVEGVGPVLLDQLGDLLNGADLTVVPVIDLHEELVADAYEVPESIKRHVRLTTPNDYFPWGECTSRTMDLDHCTPYQKDGPPAQTGTRNLGPLSRGHHRVKTFQPGWASRCIGPGIFVWRTPNRRYLLVDQRGTHRLPHGIGAGLFYKREDLLSTVVRSHLGLRRSVGRDPAWPPPDSGDALSLR